MITSWGKIAKSFTAQILFFLLAVSFILWGISDVFRAGGNSNEAARIGRTAISLAELDHSYRQYVNSLRAQGIEIGPEQARTMNLAENILRSRIQQTLLDKAAADLGLIIDDQTIAAQIRSQKIFQNEAGQFDRKKLSTILQQNGIREADYINSLRDDTARMLLLSILKENTIVPETLVRNIYGYQNEKLFTDVRILPYSAVKTTDPTDEQLADYLKAHENFYRVPETRRLTVATLSATDLTKDIRVSDEDIQALYDQKKDDMKQSEQRRIQFVVLKDKNQAEIVARNAKSGQKLLTAARAEDKNAKLETMDKTKKGALPEALDRAVFSLPVNGVSDAIETPLGFYIVQLVSIDSEKTPSLAEVRNDLVKELKDTKAGDIFTAKLQELDDMLAGGASLEEAKKSYPLNFSILDKITVDGRINGKVPEFKFLGEVLKPAFELSEGQTSPLFELKNGDYAVVRIDQIIAANTPSMNDIRAKLAEDWRQAEQARIAGERAEEIRTSWRSNNDMTALEQKYAARKEQWDGVMRDVKDNKDSGSFTAADRARALSSLKTAGDITVTRARDGMAVIKLREIKAPDTSRVKPADLQPIRDNLTNIMINEQLDALLENTAARYKVTLNHQAIQRLYER